MSVVQNFECWWKFPTFGRNSWFLKVLAHEISDGIQKKKIKRLIFMVCWGDVLIIHSQDELLAKVWMLLEFFNFWLKFMSFKGVSLQKRVTKSKKKLKHLIFMVWRMHILIEYSQDERCAKFWVLLEIFNFWWKFLSFKGNSPQKECRNPKKYIWNL